MENNLKFNSAICTSRSQSERLLALGLKKETADMVHTYLNQWDGWHVRQLDVDESIHHMEIPAWSLGRLLKIIQPMMENQNEITIPFDNIFDQIIDCIEWLIKEGYFNKEYLV